MELVKRWILLFCLIILTVGGNICAMPPLNQKDMPAYQALMTSVKSAGICQASSFMASTGTFRVLALLVEFSDKPNQVAEIYFDSLLFNVSGNSVRNYYSEISYAQLDLITLNLPSRVSWTTAPQTYAYYVNGKNGFGAYPQNAQKLVEDLVDLVDGSVDFSQYDNDGNGEVDVLVVIHTGSGAEATLSANDIWSHKWGISPRLKDGVTISDYTMQPEYWYNPGDMTIGVYAHELGHGFNMPDLYDVDYSSYGIGKWCLMSYGSWNGYLGNSPAHPCAWTRTVMGFGNVITLTSPVNDLTVLNVEETGTVYKIPHQDPLRYFEFFLVSNRKRVGYDFYLPGEGLTIEHIDNHSFTNSREYCSGMDSTKPPIVAIEQADGLCELEYGLDRGDMDDPFPGVRISNTAFTPSSNPSSNWYMSQSNVNVTDIKRIGADISIDFNAVSDTIPPDTIPPDTIPPDTIIVHCCNGEFRGDVDGDGSDGTKADLKMLRDYAHNGSPIPACFEEADLNYDGLIDQSDFKILNTYVRKGGLLPTCTQWVTDRVAGFSAYPNPFNPATVIYFELPQPAFVRLEIYNISGQLVNTLIADDLEVGHYSAIWNGAGLASGIYLARLQIGENVHTKKLMLLK